MQDEAFDPPEPQLKAARAEAARTLERCTNGLIPVVLNEIVQAMQIPVREADLSCEGVAQSDGNGTFFIMYRRNSPRVRQRFTVAHELGHIILEHIPTLAGASSTQCSKGSQELEANAFAAELLVPSKHLRAFVKNKDKSLEDVMRQYQVSKDTATRAIMQNRLLNKLFV